MFSEFLQHQADCETRALASVEAHFSDTHTDADKPGRKRTRGVAQPSPTFTWQLPSCPTCLRPQERPRFCHECDTEVFNTYFLCPFGDEGCGWEACPQCFAKHLSRGVPCKAKACGHKSCQQRYLHAPPADEADFRAALTQAAKELALAEASS